MPRTCMSICTRSSFPILEWSDILFLFKIIWSFRQTCKTVLLLSDFLNKLFGNLEQMYLLVCAMTNLVFSHVDIMYVVEVSVCLSTDISTN